MTYTDSLRLYFRGDTEKAKTYVREARRLAFLLLRRTADTGVKSARRRWAAADGTTIEVIIAGLEVTAIIDVPTGKKELRDFEDFVTHARSQTLPDGIDPEFPQQILRPSWTTFFYSNLTPGFEDFTGAKGTYKLNPDGSDLFPDGIVHAGEVDWRGPDKERISWYGPTTRYWYDAFRQPSAQYGRFVFHLGQVLLDVDQFQVDHGESWNEQLVVGAAVRQHEEDGRWLYVVLSDMVDQVTPPVALDPSSAYWSQNYPLEDVTMALRRFKLIEDLDTTEAARWKIAEGEPSQLLWNQFAPRACSPWIFNRECTKATTFAQELSPLFVYSDELSEELAATPPSQSQKYELTINEDGTASAIGQNVWLAEGASEAQVGVDYDLDGNEIQVMLGRGALGVSAFGLYLRMGDTTVPLYHKAPPFAGYTDTSVHGALVAVDARERFAVVDYRTWSWIVTSSPSSVNRTSYVGIYCAGTYTSSLLDDTTGTASGLSRFDRDIGALDATAEHSVGPLSWLWYQSSQLAFFEIRVSGPGLTAASRATPFHPDDIYGQFGTRAVDSPPANTTAVASLTSDNFTNNRKDVHDHRNAMGAAAVAGICMASFYDPRKQFSDLAFDPNLSYHYVSSSDLPTLTGVQAPQERYHPLWVLGQPIGGEL